MELAKARCVWVRIDEAKNDLTGTIERFKNLGVSYDEFIEMVKALDKAHPFYEYVSLICDGLSAFTNLSPTLIPENSLIREFIGS